MSKVIAIIQTRLASSRLPNKALLGLGGKEVLAHVVARAKQIKEIDDVIVGTSFSETDRRLIAWCQLRGIRILRGGSNEDDVLGRYYDIAKAEGADVVVRITGDCPCIDPAIGSLILEHMADPPVGWTHWHYASNILPPLNYPDGLDIEAISFDALEQLHNTVTLPSDREHVTTYIRNHQDEFRTLRLSYEKDLSSYRLTLDTPEDYQVLQALFKELGDDFGLEAAVKWLDEHPEIAAINGSIARNEGYEKTKKKDKKTNDESR